MASAHELLGLRPLLTTPRLLGVLVAVWGLRAAAEAYITGEVLWAGAAVCWLVAATYLLMDRLIPIVAPLVLALIGFEFVLRPLQLSGLELLAWLALILGVTGGRPHDRALLLRSCVTIVYSFAALAKLNPSWLAGDGIAGLIDRRPHLSSFQNVADSPELASIVAIAVICLELWLAVGLWHRKTRRITALAGVILHLAFVVGVSDDAWAAAYLSIFNFGLVACYPAFWAEIRHTGGRLNAETTTQPLEAVSI